MAKNKREVDRQLKQDEIEEVASRLFLDQGYDSTSMARVAAASGVAPNTLYWYFANKDEMLVAVLNRLVKASLNKQMSMLSKPLSEQLLWALTEFDQAHKLVMTVHARLEHSEVIRAWHDQFHKVLDQLLVSQLRAQGMTAAKASVMATVGTYVIEGLMSHPHSMQQRETVIRWLSDAANSPN